MNTSHSTHNLTSCLPYLIALITLAVFSPVLWHEFVNYDDPVVVYSNPHVLSGLTSEAIYWALTSDFVSNWVPLTMLSHMLDFELFGMNPSGHHAVNLLFHVASSVLLFLLFKRATKAPLKSAAVAFLFALHPLQVESVAWISERKDVLSAFFWMLTMYSYVLYSEKPSKRSYLTVLGVFALGLLSKPMVVTLPVVLLLFDWWPLGRFMPKSVGNKAGFQQVFKLLVEKIPFFVLSGCLSLITYLLKQSQGEIVTDISLPARVGRAFILYCGYLYKMIWPVKLSVFYPVSGELQSTALVIGAMVFFLLVSVTVLLLRNRYPFLITGWLWYVATLLPVIGLIQSGACIVADRYTYLPLIGLFVMLVWGWERFAERWQSYKYVFATVLATGLVGMVILTSIQLRYWKNSFTLLSHAIEVTDNNWLALNNLGQAYLNAGRVDDAIWYFNESVTAKPTYVVALVNLGALLLAKNRSEEAVAVLNRALRLEPENEKAKLLLHVLQISGSSSATRQLN